MLEKIEGSICIFTKCPDGVNVLALSTFIEVFIHSRPPLTGYLNSQPFRCEAGALATHLTKTNSALLVSSGTCPPSD